MRAFITGVSGQRDTIARFNDKFWIDPISGCWLWQGKKLSSPPNNYGRFWLHGRFVLAHRASWVLHRGGIPDGKVICHKCDDPLCVNPGHLFIGTQLDNIKDMCAKKRNSTAHGENNKMSKFTETDIKNIRAICSVYRKKYAKIARQYRVTAAAIRAIDIRATWRHV